MSELPPSANSDQELGLRTLLLYACVGPAAAVAVLGAASVVLVLAGVSALTMHISLVVAAAIAALVLIAAVFAADDVARQIRRRTAAPRPTGPDVHRLADLESMIAWGQNDLQGLAERVKAGERPSARAIEQGSGEGSDPFARVATALQGAQQAAWNAVLDVAGPPAGGSEPRVEVFVNLARRMQSLSHRAIKGLDDLENQVEDPDLLKGLFAVDHLNTRIRRQAESLAVIGGASSRRQWSRPVTLYEVLRSAVAEVEQYKRVKLVPPIEGTLDGASAADVIHLVAELVENATKFAPPHTQVLLRAERVAAGVVVEVEDRGLGIPRENQHRLNELLAKPDRSEIDELLRDGRIGLLVVAALARRHGIAVQLRTNLFGGTQAVVVFPHALVGAERAEPVVASTPAPAQGVDPLADAPRPSLSARRATPVAVEAEPPADQRGVDPLADAPRPSLPARRATPVAVEAEPPADHRGERPPLPVRPVQRSLPPELQTAASLSRDEEPEAEHTPGLMAAFQRGVRSGQESDEVAGTSD